MNYINLFNLWEFSTNQYLDTKIVKNVLTNESVFVRKLNLINDNLNFKFYNSLKHIKKFEFLNHKYFLKIKLSFIYENHLYYISEGLDLYEWDTLQSYISEKKTLPEKLVK